MRNHIHRVLSEYHLTPPQWAILSTASYYLPAPVDQFVIEAQLESDENFTLDQLTDAFDKCVNQGLISSRVHPQLHQLVSSEQTPSSDHLDSGIVLTEAGNELKENVGQAILEMVEID